jgi:acetyltransferase-like isoleucine patch superfamily enzyme
LPFKEAWKLPILVNPRTILSGRLKKYSLKISADDIHFGMVKLGITMGPFRLSKKDCYLYVEDGQVVFNGCANIASGFHLAVGEGAILSLGDNAWINSNVLIVCRKGITIGQNFLAGWNCTLMDNDGHIIQELETGCTINQPKPILIGENVWIGACVTVLKGLSLVSGSIIPLGSIVIKSNSTPYTIYGGTPNHIIKEGVARIDM